MKTPRQLYAKQCPPTRERVAGDEGMGRNGRGKNGIKQLDSSTSNAKHEMNMASSNTIQKTMNATVMTMQKLRNAGGNSTEHLPADAVNPLPAKYKKGHRCMTNKEQENRGGQYTNSNTTAR